MGERPLRQHYGGVATAVDDRLGVPVDEWHRHRARLLDRLRALPGAEWSGPTRCTAWSVFDVVAHLTSADQFWVFTLGAARSGTEPARALTGFDPSSSLEPFVAGMRGMEIEALLATIEASTAAVDEAIAGFTDHDWASAGESPLGHLDARFLFAHCFWDSWLHERDIFVPRDPPPIRTDELAAVTWWTLLVAGLQGGLLDDPGAVAPGPDAAIDETVRFDELPGLALRVRIDSGVRIDRVDPASAAAAGSALALVEHFAGRAPADGLELPAALAAQCTRAAAIL